MDDFWSGDSRVSSKRSDLQDDHQDSPQGDPQDDPEDAPKDSPQDSIEGPSPQPPQDIPLFPGLVQPNYPMPSREEFNAGLPTGKGT